MIKNFFKLWSLVVTIPLTFMAYVAFSASGAKNELARTLPPAKPIVSLGHIDGETNDKFSIVTLRLSTKPSWSVVEKLQSHGSFLQVELPNVIVPNPGRFFDIKSPYVKKAAVFQLTPNDAAVRLFTTKNAAKVVQGIGAELLDKRVVLTIDHAKVAKLLGETTVANQAKEPTPADLILNDKPLATGGINLKEKLTSVAFFSGLLLLMAAGAWLLRPLIRRGKARFANENSIKLETIASIPLAAKQKVSLIQVGSEKILIGVTPENITFLTTLGRDRTGPSSAVPQFGNLLARDTGVESKLKYPQQIPLTQRRSSAPKDIPAPRVAHERPQREKKDVVSPAERKSQKTTPSQVRQKVNVGIDDSGVKQMAEKETIEESSQAMKTSRNQNNEKAIEDVTQLIREKLKTLRSI